MFPGIPAPSQNVSLKPNLRLWERNSLIVVNYFADPYAVKELLITSHLHQGLPRERFIMLPLDITTPHDLPFPVYKDIVDPTLFDTSKPSRSCNKTPLVHFTSSFLERTREIMLQFGKDAMELHDIVAVWCAIANPPFQDHEVMTFADGWKAHARNFDIERYISHYFRVP